MLEIADALGVGGSGLGELSGHAADLHDGHAHREREYDRHLEDDAELLPDVVSGEVVEALGAVSGLEQEGVAGGDSGEGRLQRARLAGEHQRGHRRDLLEGGVVLALVGPGRLVLDRQVRATTTATTDSACGRC